MLTLTIDLDAAVPVYRQIADGVRGLIARGELLPGSELPSVRELGGRLGVNPNTVAKAWRELAEEGLLELRHGAGVTVRTSPLLPLDDEAESRQLEALFARWALSGLDRPAIEARLSAELQRFYQRGTHQRTPP